MNSNGRQEGRHYNRLSPIVPFNVDELEKFKTRFWDYYGDLLEYKKNPKPETAEKLSSEFDNLFSTKTGYAALDERIEKTRSKKKELLLVLKYPWLPLHNNDAELGAKVQRWRNAGKMSACKQNRRWDNGQRFIPDHHPDRKKAGRQRLQIIYDRVSKTFSMLALSGLIFQNAHLK